MAGDKPKKSNTLQAQVKQVIDERKKTILKSIVVQSRIERQKLGRRQKNAASHHKDDDLTKFKEEIQALSKVDIPELVDRHIRKILLRIKVIVDANVLPPELLNKQHAPFDRATSAINSRIFQSKRAKYDVDHMISTIKKLIDKHSSSNTHSGEQSVALADAIDELDNSEASGDDAGSFASFSSEESHEIPQTTSVADLGMFLPSLNGVGYLEDADSDASDLEEEAPRKNRRGQRARQAIWEKKYREKAKHLQKQEEKKNKSRDQGWDAQRGAVGEDDPKKQKRSNADMTNTGESAQSHPEKRQKDDDGSLHPSWIARKQMKSKESAPLESFSGKKITFD